MGDNVKKRVKFLPKLRRSQVTIFIIIAILIIILTVLIYIYYPKIKSTIGLGENNPTGEIKSCIEKDITNSLEPVTSQGGSIDPEHYILYNDDKIEYLCYTEEYYKPCIMQQPMLKQHIESEIKKNITNKVKSCFNKLKSDYEKKGYEVSLKQGVVSVELLPKRIVVDFNSTLSLKKTDSQSYNNFKVVLDNNLYELVSIANSILNWEARYGDAETTTYMNYYHDLKVEKKKLTDGSTIYILTDRNNQNKFQFAARSVALPPGYGTDKVI
ncbi:MAG: hypothetical protein AABW81_04025 [Nanoarchaeota archaeon]